jgi:LacI family transcriptional regulator
METASHLIEYAQKSGYTVSVYKALGNDLSSILDNLMSNRISGVVNFSSEFPKKYLDSMKELGIKVIRGSYYDNDFKMDVKWKDAVYQAYDKMIERGAKNVLFISGLSEEYYKVDSRVKYFLEYSKEKGLPVTEDSVIKGNYPYVEPYIVGEQSVKKIIEKGILFDGLFCINDMMAIGAINALKRKGYNVPNDVKVVGFYDIMMGSYLFPSLSTISIDAKKEARLYFNYIADNNQEEELSLDAKFIERESTGGIF